MDLLEFAKQKKKCKTSCSHRTKEEGMEGTYFEGDSIPTFARCIHSKAPKPNSVKRLRPYWCPLELHNIKLTKGEQIIVDTLEEGGELWHEKNNYRKNIYYIYILLIRNLNV